MGLAIAATNFMNLTYTNTIPIIIEIVKLGMQMRRNITRLRIKTELKKDVQYKGKYKSKQGSNFRQNEL